MKATSHAYATASGTVGGRVFAGGRSSMVVRRRVRGINRATELQVANRSAFGLLAARWRDTLTPAQRDAWQVYAQNSESTALGTRVRLDGRNAFTASNLPKLSYSIDVPFVDDGPTVFGQTPMTVDELKNLFTGFRIRFLVTDEWANVTGGFLFLLQGKPQNPAIRRYRSNYRYINHALGNTSTPPPATIQQGSLSPAWNFNNGQRIFVRAQARSADGRLSVPWSGSLVIS